MGMVESSPPEGTAYSSAPSVTGPDRRPDWATSPCGTAPGHVGVRELVERRRDLVAGVVVKQPVPEPAVQPVREEHADLGLAATGLGRDDLERGP